MGLGKLSKVDALSYSSALLASIFLQRGNEWYKNILMQHHDIPGTKAIISTFLACQHPSHHFLLLKL